MGYPVHLQLLSIVKEFSKFNENDLTDYVIRRQDPQNFATAATIFSDKVCKTIERLLPSLPLLTGLKIFLDFAKIYYQMYTIKGLSLYHRIFHAAFTILFLREWKTQTKPAFRKSTMLSQETQTDICIACSYIINLIRFKRDYCPALEINFEDSGTNCVETQFSKYGSARHNNRVYSIYDSLKSNRKLMMQSFMYSSRNFTETLIIPVINKARETVNKDSYDPKLFFDIEQFSSNAIPTDKDIAVLWKIAKTRVQGIFATLNRVPSQETQLGFVEDLKGREHCQPIDEETELVDELERLKLADTEESILQDQENYFNFGTHKVHKKHLSKLVNTIKLSNDRLKRIMSNTDKKQYHAITSKTDVTLTLGSVTECNDGEVRYFMVHRILINIVCFLIKLS